MSDVILKATYETLYMVIGSTFFAVILGFVPAIILTLTAPDGLKPNKVVYTILDILVNIFTSLWQNFNIIAHKFLNFLIWCHKKFFRFTH